VDYTVVIDKVGDPGQIVSGTTVSQQVRIGYYWQSLQPAFVKGPESSVMFLIPDWRWRYFTGRWRIFQKNHEGEEY